MAKQSEVDALAAEVESLKAQLEKKETALSEARKGLFRIIDASPTKFITGPVGSGQKAPIVKCYEHMHSVADRTVLKMSDAEEENE